MSQSREAEIDVLLVGVDAACHDVLDPLFRDGELPTLQSIFGRGVDGPLESQIPPWTPSAWPSLYTGTNPGKHGVFGFLNFEGYEWDVANATHVTSRPLWQLLDQHGHSSVVVNVPMTHPPRPFDGALVPGYVAPEEPQCHPEGLMSDVEETVGEYRIYSESQDGPADAETFRDFAMTRGEVFG
jgi:predicted AlkP superfamily phosphohydrolase/phosphomutase